MYLQQKIFLIKYFCMYIAKNLFFRKINKPMKYNVYRTIIFGSTPQNIFLVLFIL